MHKDWGLGSPNQNLPGCGDDSKGRGQFKRFMIVYGAVDFFPLHQGVKFRRVGDPVLYLSNPPRIDKSSRRKMLDGIARINWPNTKRPATQIQARIAQYEMAYRMQTSVPELVDLSDEPKHVTDLYGKNAKTKGTLHTLYDCQTTC